MALPIPANEQHIFHHSEGIKLNLSVEKNSRGYNYSATVTNSATVEEAMTVLKDAVSRLRKEFEVIESVDSK